MADLFIPDFDKTDPSFSAEKTEHYHLLCSLSQRMLVFVILDKTANRFIRITRFSGHDFLRGDDVFKEIPDFIRHLDYFGSFDGPADVVFETSKCTLVPEALFDSQNPEAYTKLSFNLQKDQTIMWDKIPEINAFNLYPLPPEVLKLAREVFQNAGIFSFPTVFIAGILSRYKNRPGGQRVFLNLRDGLMDIVALKGNRFEYFNTFDFKADTDVIYFLIFVFEQLGINPEEAELSLSGMIDHRSGLYELIQRYVRDVRFEKYPGNFNFSYVFSEVPAHQYCTLLNFHLCEL
ncbi:MAG: DUF3822 family protein [Bacteroidales bacterium]|nr:DUF3822 family protein [Bacteroidales bacterium]